MSAELFLGYRGVLERDGNVAAAQVSPENVVRLAQITGGISVTKKVRGGTMMYCGLIIHGEEAKVGDYVVAVDRNTFSAYPKAWFENKFKLHGVLRDNVR